MVVACLYSSRYGDLRKDTFFHGMTTARKVLSNTLFQISGRLITAVLGIAVVKILSTYLGKEGYGEYVTVFVFLSYFGIAADLGLFTMAVREMSKTPAKIPYIFGNVLGLRLFLAICSMGLAVLVAFVLPFFLENWHGTKIPLGVAVAAIGTVFSIMSGTVSSLLQVNYKMKYETLGLIVNKVVAVSYMVYVAYIAYSGQMEKGFYQVLWGGVAASFCMLLVTASAASKLSPLRMRFDFSFWRELFFQSLPFGVALVLNVFYFKLDVMLLSFMRGSEEVGIYGVPMKMLEVIYFLPVYFMNSMLPVISREVTLREKHGENAGINRILQYAFDFMVLCAAPMLVGGFVLAYPIVFLISNPEYLSRLADGFYGSDIALKILLFAMFFSFINAMFGIVLVTLNKQKRLMWINFVGVIVNLTLNLISIPFWGFRGAAIASVISVVVVVLLTSRSVKKALQLRLSYLPSLKIVICALAMGATVYGLRGFTYALWQNANVFLLIPVGGAVYVGMLFLTGVVNREMIKTMFRKEPVSEEGRLITD